MLSRNIFGVANACINNGISLLESGLTSVAQNLKLDEAMNFLLHNKTATEDLAGNNFNFRLTSAMPAVSERLVDIARRFAPSAVMVDRVLVETTKKVIEFAALRTSNGPLWLNDLLKGILETMNKGMELFCVKSEKESDQTGQTVHWTDRYFGPDYFGIHPLYEPDPKKDIRETNFITEIASLWANGKVVLDMCCGYGRHSIELARRGFQVVGIDNSEYMLDLARKNAFGVGNVVFEEQDMKVFDYIDRFNLVLSIFSSFGLFNDLENEKVIENVARSMKKGAIFILDTVDRSHAQKGIMGSPHREHIIKEKGIKLVEDYHLDESTGVLQGTNRSYDLKDGKLRTQGTFYLRLYTFKEIQQLLQKYGLSVVAVHGDLNTKEAFLDNSPRMVVISKKD